jgi:hypothetical protein
MMNEENISRILQYALLVAAQNDDWKDRELGPIHLVKYVYLADMEYAKWHDGKIYTGIDWIFHHFGPWSPVLHQQIEPALAPIHAQQKKIPSTQYGKEDFIRWKVDFREDLYKQVREELPLALRHAIQNQVETYRVDTPSLLHFVYSTPPMLKAAPGEHLDFGGLATLAKSEAEPYTPYLDRLSKKKKKRLKTGMQELREHLKKKVNESSLEVYPTGELGRVDAVFEAGVEWLDRLAGEDLPEEGVTAHFSDEIWKSEARRGDA